MKKYFINSSLIFLVITFAVFGMQGCATCDDCEISPAPKQVTLQNPSGKNLIYGPDAIYDPADIVIKDEFGTVVEFFSNSSNGSIDFSFNKLATTYTINFSSKDKAIIVFTYGTDKQIDCCDEFTVTLTTTLNGKAYKIFRCKQSTAYNPQATAGQLETDNKSYLYIKASDSWISIEELQAEGKKRMPITVFLRGAKL